MIERTELNFSQRISLKIFGRLIFIQSLLMILLLLGSALFAREHFKRTFLDPRLQGSAELRLQTLEQALEVLDRSMVFSVALLGLVLTAFAIWSWRSLLFPLGRRLEKSISHIREDLEFKTESLSLEREQLSTLMSAISDAILAVGMDEVPLFFNGQFALLLGQEGLGTQNLKLWEMFRNPEILKAFRIALHDGRVFHLKAIPLDQATGRKFYSLSVSPLRRPDRTLYGAVGIFHDVTELKTAEQMRIDFVANVSHELRTPLTAIKGYADTLVQDMKDARPLSGEFLEIIVRNVDRLMNLISDLLDMSTLDAGSDGLQREKIDTEDLSHRVIAQMAPTFERKKQKVKVHADCRVVNADPTRIEQVLINLLDNACKYTPEGGRIHVHWENKEGERDVILRVVDTGPGIHPEHHQRLFERFYRVDKARSREMGGTGLGLAIVKHIMQRHGGAIWVKSEMGRGAEFICRFP